MHNEVHFNLVTDPWLPVEDIAGVRHVLGLEALFQQADSLADLDLRPHERVSVMRLLICVTQAALGAPENISGWPTFGEGFEEKITAYLQRWSSGFELFGDGQRFLQAKPGRQGEPVPVSKLIPQLATGNNPTPFDHAGGTHRPLPPGKLALALLTFQNFYPLYGAGYKGRGPCADGNMIHTLVRGKNLRETILRNCLDQTVIDRPQLGGMGRPIWEKFPASPTDQPAVANATRTYLGRLAPLHRTVWLGDDCAGFLLGTDGWEYPRFDVYREPTATVIFDSKKNVDRLLWASLHRAVWRELHALTVQRHTGTADSQASGPLVMESHHDEGSPDDEEIWTGALVTDLKAKILDTVESVFRVPARMFDDTGRKQYQDGVAYAQLRSKHLYIAVNAYGEAVKHDSPPTERASRHYWNALDQQSVRLLEIVRDENQSATTFGGASKDLWTHAVRGALQRAYDAVCPRLTPRQYKAYNAGLAQLHPAPAKKSGSKAKGPAKPLPVHA